VIVVSESMQPALYRGDIVFLQGLKPAEIKAQEINVFFPVNGMEFSEFAKAYYTPSQASSIGFEIKSIEVNDKNYFPNKQGDIIVYYSIPNNEQIIHRAILKINSPEGTFLLTKGDNSATNFSFDQDKFCVRTNNPDGTFGVKCFSSITKFPVNAELIDGKAVFTIPMLGCVKVWVFDDLFSLLRNGSLPSNYKGGLC
jgi:signal peptidase I